ncbi:MAG: serine hydrolase [Saprospiraceae bacterium]
MKKYFFAISILLFNIACNSQPSATTIAENPTELNQKVNEYIETIQERYGIPGAAVAIIKDGKVIHRNNYGYANLEHQVPITDASIFRLYSLTKPLVAVAVFQLLEAGKLNLEDRVDQYFTDLPTTWNGLQIKHLLSHSSGLPDMAPVPLFENLTEEEAKAKVFAQPIRFGAGEEYSYNQTNFWLLQQIIEQLSGTSMADFIIKNQFNSPTDTVFFSSDSRDIIRHRVTPYFPFRNGKRMIDHSYLQGDYGLAMNGLNITLDKFINWNQRLRNDELLKKETKELMWTEYPYTKKNASFAYSWDARMVNKHRSYGFSGSLVTAYRVFPDDDLSIMLFCNGLGRFFDIEDLVNHLASFVNKDIFNPNYLAFETLLKAGESDFSTLKTSYYQLKKDYPQANLEAQINSVGYMIMNSGQLATAIDIFTLNTEEFPTSWNTFDSLGEAYLNANDLAKAKRYYEQSLQLNPDNNNGAEMLDEISKRQKQD